MIYVELVLCRGTCPSLQWPPAFASLGIEEARGWIQAEHGQWREGAGDARLEASVFFHKLDDKALQGPSLCFPVKVLFFA